MDGFFSRSEMMRVRAPSLPVAQCGACGLYRSCRSPKMKVAGRGARRILVVGDAPDSHEDERGEPFTGKSGRYLERVMDDLGVDLHRDCWLTNAVICHPGGQVPERAVEYCRPNVVRTITDLSPDTVILLGGEAVEAVIGHLWKEHPGGVRRWAGVRIPSVQLNSWVCPTYDPLYLARMEEAVLDREFEAHIRQAVSGRGRPHPKGPPDYAARCEVVLDPNEAARRLNRIRDGLIAFDYETDRLKPDHRDSWLVCASVCHNGTGAFAFPWRGAAVDAMRDVLTDPGVKKSGANISMEHGWTYRQLGVWVRGWVWDSVTGAHALDPRGGGEGDKGAGGGENTSLKYQAFVRLGVPDYAGHIKPFLSADDEGGNAVNRIREIDLPTLLRYNALDSLVEYHVGEHQRREMGYDLREMAAH